MKAQITIVGTYDIPDDIEERERLYKTSDIDACLRIDQEFAEESPGEFIESLSDGIKIKVTRAPSALEALVAWAEKQGGPAGSQYAQDVSVSPASALARAWSGDNEPGDTRPGPRRVMGESRLGRTPDTWLARAHERDSAARRDGE